MLTNLSAKHLIIFSIFLVAILSISMTNLESVKAENGLMISVNISNNGETTLVTGKVTDQDQTPIEGAKVSIQVNDPSDKIVYLEYTYTNSDGVFTDSFNPGVNGECTMYISANKAGYDNANTQTKFTAVPEFSSLFVQVTLVLSIILTIFILRRKNSK